MLRFITEQYAEALPIGYMLGYVMDGDVVFARQQLNTAILNQKTALGLISGPTGTPPVHNIERFITGHKKINSSQIELRHALLPFAALAAS